MIKTAGSWDAAAGSVYFAAGQLYTVAAVVNDGCRFVLVPINELNTEANIEQVVSLLDRGAHVLIDSGVFDLANTHAEKAGISMDAALATRPDDIPGFDELLQRYLKVLRLIGDRAWGYIEIDQGGRENKIRTRAMLEERGLRPIPVYHPFNDGWDYFDELAASYDRICLGNVVQADRATRLRLLATIWERSRQYPDLWIHVLGLTPNEWVNAYPLGSCDSSAWIGLTRWAGAARETAALKSLAPLDHDFTYDRTADVYGPRGHRKAWRLGAVMAQMKTLNWRALRAEYEALGFDTRGTL